MDKIRIDFFDILGYLIPGSALLVVLWIGADGNIHSIWESYVSIIKINKKALFIALLFAYVGGFVLHALGNLMYDLYRAKKFLGYSPSQAQGDWAMIRQHGEKHLAILERWYALRALSQNLAAVSLISILVCVFKWIKNSNTEWLLFAFVSLIITFILLKRSEIFHHHLNDDIKAIKDLNLGKPTVLPLAERCQ